MTSEPRRIAESLYEECDPTPAAILVALTHDPMLAVLREDVTRLTELARFGCVSCGRPTPLGQRVALVLRSVHGVEPAPREVLG